MAGVVLDPVTAKPVMPAARSLLVAPRMPERPNAETYRTPFDAEGDIVVDCDMAGCDWHAMGPRAQVGLAVKAHHRMFHSEQIGVVRLNQPGQ